MSEFVCDADTTDFEHKVVQASHQVPVLVDFWAEWCGPCRILKPILEKLAVEYGGRFRLVKVDSDREPELARRFGVRGIPNVKAFVGGQLVDEFTGALPEGQIRAFIDGLLPSPAEPLRREALAAFGRGDLAGAQRLLEQAVAADPELEAARLDLVEVQIERGELEPAASLIRELEFRVRDEDRLKKLQALLALRSNMPADTSESELAARVAADPADLEARLALATLAAERGEFRPAFEHLIEIVRRDRSFRDDIGRKTMLQLFELIGSGDPLVREFRGELATLINR